MSVHITTPSKNFDFNNIQLMDPVPTQGGSYFTKLRHRSHNMYVQTPLCGTKQGFAKTSKKVHMDMMLDHDKEEFISWMVGLETRCQEYIYESSADWFQNPMDLSDIENAFHTCVKIGKKGGCTLRANVKTNAMTGEPLVKIYDQNETSVTMDNVTSDKEILAILEITGVRFTTRSFQLEVEVKQVMVMNKDEFQNCLIKVDSSKTGGATHQNNGVPAIDENASAAPPPSAEKADVTETSIDEIVSNDIAQELLEPQLVEHTPDIMENESPNDNNDTTEDDTPEYNVRFDANISADDGTEGITLDVSEGDKLPPLDTMDLGIETLDENDEIETSVVVERNADGADEHDLIGGDIANNHEEDEEDEEGEENEENGSDEECEEDEEDEEDDSDEEGDEEDYFIPTAKLEFGEDIALDDLEDLSQSDPVLDTNLITCDTEASSSAEAHVDEPVMDIMTEPSNITSEPSLAKAESAENSASNEDNVATSELVEDIIKDLDTPSSDIQLPEEHNLDIFPLTPSDSSVVTLKPRTDHYYDMYREARKMARKSKQEAVESYLKAKDIKKRYLLDTPIVSSDEEDGGSDAEISGVPGVETLSLSEN